MKRSVTLSCALLLAFTTVTWGADKPAPKTHAKPPVAAAAKTPAKAAAKKPAKAAPRAAAAKGAPKAAAKPVTRAAAQPAVKAPAKSATRPPATPVAKVEAKPEAAASVVESAGRPAPTTAPRTFAATYQPVYLPAPSLSGKSETLTCRDGTEDRHARIGVVLIGGRVDSFAYYSKWKPRTCSIYVHRNRDGHSKWAEKGNVTSVNLERGVFLIEHDKGTYRFTFRDVDRERYCGMEGTINGTLTVRKGSEQCELVGVMEEGVPLGQAYANLDQAGPVAADTASAPATPLPQRGAERSRREPQSVFPSGVND